LKLKEQKDNSDQQILHSFFLSDSFLTFDPMPKILYGTLLDRVNICQTQVVPQVHPEMPEAQDVFKFPIIPPTPSTEATKATAS
jgi:hypothetical protein